jgi:hypothetical protein
LANNTANWTRSPATNTITRNSATAPFWVVSTSSFNYDRRAGHAIRPRDTTYPDIYAGALLSAPNTAWISRTLPAGLPPAWRLEAELLIAGCDKGAAPATPSTQHMRIELLDAADKIIARLNANETSAAKIWKLFGNNTEILSATSNDAFWAATRRFTGLVIRSDGAGNILFAFGDYPEITTSAD